MFDEEIIEDKIKWLEHLKEEGTISNEMYEDCVKKLQTEFYKLVLN